MATAKTTVAEITEIQRQMAQVRHELHQEAQGMVKGAQSLTDWRSHVRHHPWLALGAAAAAGYLIVPRRRQEQVPTIVAVAPQAAGVMAPARAAAEPGKKKRWGLIGSAVGLLAPIAIRAVQNYAIQYLEQWIASQPPGGGASVLGAGLFPGAAPPGGGGGPGPRPAPAPGGGGTRPRDVR
jgi:hypothetical protein